ncbi:hypothetical protein M9434_006740 [Picochlorum sp. BPE23]|nr:hypothetical protein M9434_006740 [Picochlorum sp. BPE23]
MVLMVKDNEQDAVERERILSAKKINRRKEERDGSMEAGCSWTQDDNAVEESFFTCQSDQPTTGKSRTVIEAEEEGSSVEIHHDVEPVVEGGEQESWMRIQSPPAETPGVSSGKRDFPMPSQGTVSRIQSREREAKVEDVIRRHTIQRANDMKEIMHQGEEQCQNSKGRGMEEEAIRKTPVRKKGRKRKGKKKGRKFVPKFLGQLFSSTSSPHGTPSPIRHQAGPRMVLPPMAKANVDFGEDVKDAVYKLQRPPALSVRGMKYDQPGRHQRSISQEKCLSPLMVTSPGLSCGGLLGEEFATAMRDVEKMEQVQECEVSFNNNNPDDSRRDQRLEATIAGSALSSGAARVDSHMSPRITASPREVQRMSSVKKAAPASPVQPSATKIVHQDPPKNCMTEDVPRHIDRRDTVEDSNNVVVRVQVDDGGLQNDETSHAKLGISKALFPEDELERLKKQSLESHLQEPMISLRIHEQEMSKLEKRHAAMIDNLTQQHNQHVERIKTDLEGQLSDALRQKEVVENTSTSLANQLALLYSRVKIAEKKATEAVQELQMQKSSMQMRSSTFDRLHEEIQNLSRENTRLIREKASMEHHTRQLTSILHTIMSADSSAKQNEELVWDALHQQASGDDQAFKIPGTEDDMAEHMKHLSVTSNKEEAHVDPGQGELATEKKNVGDHRKPLTASNTTVPPPPDRQQQQPSEDTSKEMKLKRTAELDKQLLELNMEKEKLDMELSHMPATSAGRTVAQRRRRRLVENRLDDVQREIGKVKRELRKMKAI